MTKKQFIRKLNYWGWKDVEKSIKGLSTKGTIKIIKKRRFKRIVLPSINN